MDFLSPKVVDDLHHWIDERGFSGVRIRAADGTTAVPTPGRGLDDERMAPVWQFLSDRRVPVCIQMHAQHAPILAGLLQQYPGLTAILDHAGRPQLDDAAPYPSTAGVPQLEETGRVFIKLTPPAVLRAQRESGSAAPVVRTLIEKFGAANVMWGSNFPASAGSLSELHDLIKTQLPSLDDTRAGTDRRRHRRPAVRAHPCRRRYPRREGMLIAMTRIGRKFCLTASVMAVAVALSACGGPPPFRTPRTSMSCTRRPRPKGRSSGTRRNRRRR